MDQQLKCAEDEAQQYQSFLQKLDREEGTEDEAQANIKQLQEQLKKLLAEEDQLKETLNTLDSEKQAAKQVRHVACFRMIKTNISSREGRRRIYDQYDE